MIKEQSFFDEMKILGPVRTNRTITDKVLGIKKMLAFKSKAECNG